MKLFQWHWVAFAVSVSISAFGADQTQMVFQHPDPTHVVRQCDFAAEIVNFNEGSIGNRSIIAATCSTDGKLFVYSTGLLPGGLTTFGLRLLKKDISCADLTYLAREISDLRSPDGVISTSVDCDRAVAVRFIGIRVARLK